MTNKKTKNQNRAFVTKQFNLGKVSGFLVAMENSGIIKLTYTETTVEVTVWDNKCENILHRFVCKHEDMLQKEEEENNS